MRLKPALNHESQRVIVLINFGFDISRHGHVLQSMFYICHSNERYCLTTQRRFTLNFGPIWQSDILIFGTVEDDVISNEEESVVKDHM